MVEALLEKISEGLAGRGIPYMVIGGQAVLLYGEPRLTRDVDITLGAGLERLAEVEELAAACGLRTLASAEFVRRTWVLPCDDPATGLRVDFIFSFSAYERQAIERAHRVAVGKAQVRFAAPEDLIIHKVVAGRSRDLEDVRGILLKNPGLDLTYVEQQLREFDQSLGEGALARFRDLRGS